jgi:DNA-binding NarL/FixJ family response regulator
MTILVVDDHALVRDGLKRLLATLSDNEILEAVDGRDALSKIKARRPDLVILDLNLPGLGGLELLRRMIQMGAGPILVLSMHAEPLYARRALEAGAAGYMTKNASPDELLVAVRRVTAGGRYVEADIAQALAAPGAGVGGPQSLDNLSARELEIMRLLANGASLAEIAAAVGVGYKTVANNCSQIKSKLGVSRTADLVRLAIETGVT